MLLFNEEKQILQKYYVETIKSRSNNLKNIIQEQNIDALKLHLDNIEVACKRIRWLESAFEDDLKRCCEKEDK